MPAFGQKGGVPGISAPTGVTDPAARKTLGELKEAVEHIVGHQHNQTDIAITDTVNITLPQLAAIVKRILDERLRG
jgi:hypothetical protein